MVKRDKPTRCNKSHVYYQTSISTCFGHHYAHHRENKTMYYCIWFSALVVLAVVMWSWDASCVHCVKVTVRFKSNSNLHTVHTAYDPALHNHSQHNQCRKPYTVIHGLVLLMMGIMMPETCWDRSLIINIGFVTSCWFISLHPAFRDARSQEPKTWKQYDFFPQKTHYL